MRNGIFICRMSYLRGVFMRKSHFFRRDIDIYIYASFLVFAISCVISAIYARSLGKCVSEESLISHFAPSVEDGGIFPLMARSFCDDAFDVLYIFALGFMAWGKPITFGILAYRGILFGYYFTAMNNTFARGVSLPSIFEYGVYILFGIICEFLIVRYSCEALNFNSFVKDNYRNRRALLKTKKFRMYVFDTVIICGIIAVLRSLYTVTIIIL